MLFLHISFVFAKIQDIKNHLANQHKSTSNPPPPPSLSIYLYMCTYNTYVDRVNKIRKKYVGKIRLLKFIRTWHAFSFSNHQTSHAFISPPPLPKTSKPSPHCLYSSLTSLTCTVQTSWCVGLPLRQAIYIKKKPVLIYKRVIGWGGG